MRRKTNSGAKPKSSSFTPLAPVTSSELATKGLSDEQVIRWAELIATGRSEPPGDLCSPDMERLEAAVHELLNKRMVGLIARAIAADILRERREVEEQLTC